MSLRINAALALTAVVLLADSAGAQTPTEGGPRLWVTASAGPSTFPQLNFFNTASRENIDMATTYRGAIEVDAGKVGGIGLSVSSTKYGATYVGGSVGSPCRSGCPATIQATAILATLHVGGGRGFDAVYEASVGYTHFGALQAPDQAVGVRGAANDFTGMLGLGLAYGFTDELSAMVVGDVGLLFHKDPGGEGIEAGYYSAQLGVRAGLRYGLWGRAK